MHSIVESLETLKKSRSSMFDFLVTCLLTDLAPDIVVPQSVRMPLLKHKFLGYPFDIKRFMRSTIDSSYIKVR